ncbi:MAG: hypothetical protein AAF367_07680 [Pseudomonadota bacterium]
MKTLVACWSNTGRTKAVGLNIAERLGADVEIIEDSYPATGFMAMIRTFLAILLRGVREIAPPRHVPGEYDLVVIGTPIWGWAMVPPLRAYLRREGKHFARVAFFCTEGGSGSVGAFREMEKLTAQGPVATLVVRDPDYKAHRVDDLIDDFVLKLRSVGRAA